MDTGSSDVVDVSMENFAAEVIDASRQQLVMVDFWADWCGPCKSLGPILEGIARSSQGKVRLAKVDTDRHQELAAQFGIRSLPTVFFFKDGDVVDQFMGAQPESAVRAIVDRHTGDPGEAELEAAKAAYDAGNQEQAMAFVSHLIQSDPSNEAARLLMLGWLLKAGDLEGCRMLAETLSESAREDPAYKAYQSALELMEGTEELPERTALQQAVDSDPSDAGARFRLGQRLIAEQDYETGMEQLLESIRLDRGLDDDAARKLLIKVFAALGGSGELVNRYRSQLGRLLN